MNLVIFILRQEDVIINLDLQAPNITFNTTNYFIIQKNSRRRNKI